MDRNDILTSFGATSSEVAELLAYETRILHQVEDDLNLPLEDEPFVESWETYCGMAGDNGPIAAMRVPIRQLAFPIRQGISQDPDYRAVIRRGDPVASCPLATGLHLDRPDDVRLSLETTAAGRIPVITIADRGDFENILRAATRRNEPVSIPGSIGAMTVSGFNNWDRLHRYRHAWEERNPGGEWSKEFKRVKDRRDLYQDRFILLSEGPYSGIAASELDLGEDEWLRLSGVIRLHHECTHYFTKRVFDSTGNNVVDEIVADYIGIVHALGHYRVDWFLRFMGLEDYPDFRSDGRLDYYRGNPRLGDGAFRVMQSLVVEAARNLERMAPPNAENEGQVISRLTRLTLEELATLK